MPLHQEAREVPVRQQNELISWQLAMACNQLCHRPPDDRRNDDVLWSAGLDLTSSNTSPKSHSATPATCRQSAESTKMQSELPLKAAHQNCLMADRRPLPQPNRHYQGRQRLYWHNCAPVTAESLVSTWIESTRQRATIATIVVSRLMTPTTFSTAHRSWQHWQYFDMDCADRNRETP